MRRTRITHLHGRHMSAQDSSKTPDTPDDDIPFVLPITEPEDLLKREHTLNGGILFGLEGYVIEIQARAMSLFKRPRAWREATSISGMAGGAVRESLDRISGAFAKLGYHDSEAKILINLVPA